MTEVLKRKSCGAAGSSSNLSVKIQNGLRSLYSVIVCVY